MEITEEAEQTVWETLRYLNLDTEVISITGTIENMVGLGLSMEEIEAGDYFVKDHINPSIVWLD